MPIVVTLALSRLTERNREPPTRGVAKHYAPLTKNIAKFPVTTFHTGRTKGSLFTQIGKDST
jgi:hypothetical protein